MGEAVGEAVGESVGEAAGEASEVTKEAEGEPLLEEVEQVGDLMIVVAEVPQLMIHLKDSRWAICLGQSLLLKYNHRFVSKTRPSRLRTAST